MSPIAINCGHVLHELWDWLDGEMEPERLEAIREHLAICRGCAGHVAFARSFLEHVQRPPTANGELEALRRRVRDALHGDAGAGPA
ncbi:MAG TPA: zf-HC2 domain-containing protein [Gemmatimonadaceae bacterium]|nr:zf-HC2 domain-containing protein [Gemmatimonadaceae bacterium]